VYNTIQGTSIVAKKVHYLPSCHSTNDIAAELVRSNEFSEGLVVITDKQTNGRGQRGNVWLSSANKNLTFSLILQPHFIKIQDQFLISKAIAVGIGAYLEAFATDVKIKWPNDIYIGDKKIAGVLIENSIQGAGIASCIVGIGININQTDFDTDRITSIKLIQGENLNLETEFQKLCLELDVAYSNLKSAKGIQQINHAYNQHLYGFLQHRFYKVNGVKKEGQVVGISPLGMLQVQFSGEEDWKEFNNQEIEWLWA
jgi:BirA family biotin operon repressor/biotin-[acetyl-CoA-carboxylase] ligase